MSLDRSRGHYAPSVESGYASSAAAVGMSRTRSHHQLQGHHHNGHPNQNTSSSGEDSYGSGSRPHSRAAYGTYNGRGARTANGTYKHTHFHSRSMLIILF